MSFSATSALRIATRRVSTDANWKISCQRKRRNRMSSTILSFMSRKARLAILIALVSGVQSIQAQTADSNPGASRDTITTSVLYRFQYDGLVQSGFSHGATPVAELIQGADGNFYGTTPYGGSGSCADGFGVIGCGTVFKITPSGTETVLYNFVYDPNSNTAVNGIYPFGGLVQGRDGNFYGTASGGGNAGAVCNGTLGCGVVFKITPSGKYTVLHTFNGAFA